MLIQISYLEITEAATLESMQLPFFLTTAFNKGKGNKLSYLQFCGIKWDLQRKILG